MKAGFTGSRLGMTDQQCITFFNLLGELGVRELHHGNCVGADCFAHDFAVTLGCRTVIHPPVDTELAALKEGDERREPTTYLARDRNIVRETQLLIATPNKDYETPRSGTWYTVRYAIKQCKPVHLIKPNGGIVTGEQILPMLLNCKWGEV
jgi:hypothetical protein